MELIQPDRIRSEKVKERSDGLAGLSHRFLSRSHRLIQIRPSPHPDAKPTDLQAVNWYLHFVRLSLIVPSEALSDKAYHRIFETLFRISRVESSNYAKRSKAPAKTIASSRLSACAGVLRIAVEVGVRKLRHKTVKALVDHVIQTLPSSDEGYCSPLVLDYFKILRTILEYQPHPEHFPRDAWHEVTDFCIEAVTDLNSSTSDGKSTLSHRIRNSDSFQEDRSRSVTPGIRISSSHRSIQRTSQRHIFDTIRSSTEDIVLCLKHLHSVPNAPITEKANSSLQTMLEFLRTSPSVSHNQQAIFDCVNFIMARIVTDDTDLATETLKSLIPMICRLWQSKSPALKDSMLISLIYGEHYFECLLQSDVSGENRSDMHSLFEVLKDDYCKRNERDKLQIEDLDLSQEFTYNKYQSPLSSQAFRPRFGLIKAEQPWALLRISASIVTALDLRTNTPDDVVTINDDATHISKRRKLTSARVDIVRQIRTSQLSERLYALQLLAFLLSRIESDQVGLQDLFDTLLSCLSDSNESIVAWAMLALSW